MPLQPLNPGLQLQIDHAWQEIQADPQHRLRISTRLQVYDLLVADLGIAMRDLAPKESNHRFPHVTVGLKRYWYLGLQIITPLLPVWEREFDHWLTSHPGYDADRSFPSMVLDATVDLLKGIPYAEVETGLPTKTAYWAGISGWEYILGNMTEDLPYTARMALRALFNLYHAVRGRAPFYSSISDAAYDDDFDPFYNQNITFYAFDATISAVVRSHDEPQSDTRPTYRDPLIALDFWRGWLFDLVPRAATVDIDALGWKISAFP